MVAQYQRDCKESPAASQSHLAGSGRIRHSSAHRFVDDPGPPAIILYELYERPVCDSSMPDKGSGQPRDAPEITAGQYPVHYSAVARVVFSGVIRFPRTRPGCTI